MTEGGGPLRIVMVDDDAESIFLIKAIFKRADFQSEFIGLPSGRALFDHIKNNGIGSIDLLLLDVYMPVLDGHDVLAQLSAYPEADDLCKIMLSASRRMLDRDVSNHLGASAYAVKPATSEEMDAFVQLVLTVLSDRKAAIAS